MPLAASNVATVRRARVFFDWCMRFCQLDGTVSGEKVQVALEVNGRQ
jgi:hypothetical protein